MPYEAGFGEFEKLKPGARLPQVFKRIDPTTGKQVTQKLKTGDRLFNFRFPMILTIKVLKFLEID